MTADFYGMSSLLQDLENGQLGKQASDFLMKKENEAPYASLVYILQAKQTEDLEARFKAAIFSPDRGKLKRFLREEFLPYKRANQETFDVLANDEILGDQPGEEQSESPSAKISEASAVLQISDLPDVIISPIAMWKIRPLTIQMKEQDRTEDPSGWRLHIPVEHLLPVQSAALQEYIMDRVSRGVQVSENLYKELQNDVPDKDELVNRFLASPPSRPGKQPAEHSSKSLTSEGSESLQSDQNLATETLAQLHLRQNHPEEALKIYRQLRLRYPEKSVYFDAQIEKVKQHII